MTHCPYCSRPTSGDICPAHGYVGPQRPPSVLSPTTTQGMIDDAISAALPDGVIVMWSGAIVNIPTGWALCDGTSGTPDLRDRFVVGAGTTYAVAASAGAATHGHSDHVVTQPAAHAVTQPVVSSHAALNTGAGTTHSHSIASQATQNTKDQGTGSSFNFVQAHTHGGVTGDESSHYHSMAERTHSLSTSAAVDAHSGTAVDAHSSSSNLPPYYALAYIMKTA